MTLAIAAALAVAHGAPFGLLLAGAALVYHPLPGLAAVIGWSLWRRSRRSGPTPDDEAAFLHRLSAELRGGAPPRSALVRASRREGTVDLARLSLLVSLGLDDSRLAKALSEALPVNGRMAGAALAVAGSAGAPLERVVSSLARRAAHRGHLDREARSLTAQARATAWLIAGLPLLLVGSLALSGSIRLGAGAPVAVLGLALQGVGIGVVVVMLRRTP